MASRAHRARLDQDRVTYLANKADGFLGAAVAYEPGFGYVLVAGEHRYAAVVRRGDREIEVYVLRSWRDMQAWMAWDVEQGETYSQAPWNPAEAAWFMDKAISLLTTGRGEGAPEDVAEYTGVHRSALDNCRWATKLAADPAETQAIRDYTQGLIGEIVKGGGGASSLRDKVARERQRLDALAKPKVPAAKQRAMLSDAIATLTGLTDGLAHLGDPSEDLTEEEREAFAAALGKIGTRISRLKISLRRGTA